MTDAQKKQFAFFFYRIPTVTDTKTGAKRSAYPNPAHILRRFAIWKDGSVWYLPIHRTPNTMINEMRAAGCTAEVVKFDIEEYENVMASAREALDNECNRIREFVETSIAKTKKKLKKAEELQSVNEVNGAIGFMKRNFAGAKRYINAALEAMIEFDLLREKESMFDALKAEIAAKTNTFFGMEDVKQAEADRKAKPRAKRGSRKASK